MYTQYTLCAFCRTFVYTNLQKKGQKMFCKETNLRINAIADKVIEHEKKLDALTEFLKSDRKDINALIQAINKLKQTKGKK